MRRLSGKIFAALLGVIFHAVCSAQCIGSFPYVEDFENGPAWTAQSVNNGDWAWGTPNHTYAIQSAGSGNKCWSTGTLTGAFYNYSEQAFVKSPCFNFSNLQYPHISFKIFYECEYLYDGANLQSSIDGGLTWQNVGAYGDPPDCNTKNWYNHNNILNMNNPSWISVKHGWCGNIQQAGTGWDPSSPNTNCVGGNGSGQWITASHCLTGLGGKTNVLLRFTFASGQACNNFDGFAFDSVVIDNGISVTPDFTFSCAGTTINFSSVNAACPAPVSWSWDFGDGSTSSLQNPAHNFSGAGSYPVTLTATGNACNPPGSITYIVNTISANIAQTSAISCNGANDGELAAAAVPPSSSYTYQWSSGGTDDTLSGIGAGNYTVTISDAMGCSSQASITVTQPASNAAFTASTFTTDIYNPQISFFDQSPNAITWNWNFGDEQTSPAQNPLHTFPGGGTYNVVLTAGYANGCVDSVAHVITIKEEFTFYAPNSFTPDGDGRNDVFIPLGTGWDVKTFQLRIFDRWGQEIFYTDDSTAGWDGKNVQPGIYVWRAEVSDEDGSDYKYTGHILLLK